MPAGLFSPYIGSMAMWETNPENNVLEKFAFWFFKIVGMVCVGVGIYGLYVFIPIVFIKDNPLGWSILIIAKMINIILLGIGFLVHYKKSMDLISRPWIFVPVLLGLLFIFLKEWFYYKYAEPRIVYIAFDVFGILFLVFYWFRFRKKYPEEFGLKS